MEVVVEEEGRSNRVYTPTLGALASTVAAQEGEETQRESKRTHTSYKEELVEATSDVSRGKEENGPTNRVADGRYHVGL